MAWGSVWRLQQANAEQRFLAARREQQIVMFSDVREVRK